MKLFLKIFVAVALIIALAIGGLAFYITRGLHTGAELVIDSVDLNSVEDGVYEGDYNSGRFSNKVSVTVMDHKITDIELDKDITFNKPEVTKEIFDKVIEEQNVDVDSVSGATVSGKAYLKAIENALKGGKQ